MCKISIIMGIYKMINKKDIVKLAIDSILNQTYRDFEFIICDDGSNDGTYEMVQDLIKNDKRVILIKNNENKGLAYSLNHCLSIAKGEYIARMDADDISMPERFVKQIAFMNSHPDIDCLGTWAIEIDDDGKEYFRKKMPITHEECLELFKKRDCMIHPTVMFRRSYFEKAGLYPEDTYFGEDTMMWAKGFKSGCIFANVPEYLFKFRLDSNFFERRRGWKHAKSIYTLRHRVNRMLGFGWKEDCYALLYAMAKLMPKSILDIIYKTVR